MGIVAQHPPFDVAAFPARSSRRGAQLVRTPTSGAACAARVSLRENAGPKQRGSAPAARGLPFGKLLVALRVFFHPKGASRNSKPLVEVRRWDFVFSRVPHAPLELHHGLRISPFVEVGIA